MRLKVEYITIDTLKPYDKNAKIHTPEQIEQIKKSIQEFGMNDPIGIWGKDNLIVEGARCGLVAKIQSKKVRI